jgi:membrane-associated protease RseP (regulator of RpoE activity)
MIKVLPLLLLIITIFSCAPVPLQQHSQSDGTHGKDEIVSLDGIKFQINTAYFTPQLNNWVNQAFSPNATFFVVDISMTNQRTEAIPFHFRPIYTLIDKNGVKYTKSEQSTIMLNMGKRGSIDTTEVLNPNVTFTQNIVFDVPMQKYKLQVLVPYKAQMGFGGYQNVTGRYFYFNLSNVDESLSKPPKIGKLGVHLFETGEIKFIDNGSPAAEAGLKVGDIITKIDGQPIVIGNLADIGSKITGEPDTVVELTVLRFGRELTFRLKRKAF